MSKNSDKSGNARPIIIRKEEVVGGGHHGGAWKVAYADFVTAMMAFFLLMWLINATTEAQRRGLADYFSKTNIFARGTSGSGKPFGGRTPYEQGNMVSDLGAAQVIAGHAEAVPDVQDDDSDTVAQAKQYEDTKNVEGPGRRDSAGSGFQPPGATTELASQGAGKSAVEGAGQAAGKAADGAAHPGQAKTAAATQAAAQAAAQVAAEQQARAQAERAAFAHAAQDIREAVKNDPALASLVKQLAVDETPEGLRIQILDAERQPMFAIGSADPNERARLLIGRIAPILAKLPEPISVTGFTDAAPYHGTGMSNWDLSTERANATRRLLAEAGLPEQRFQGVTGRADRNLLLPAEPLAAANRRVAIVLLRSVPAAKPGPAQPASTQPTSK